MGPSPQPLTRPSPVLPLLGHVDNDCAALVQAVRRAGLHPQLCASPSQAAAVAQAEGATLVVVLASAIDMSPRRLLEALRQRGPLRVALCGPESGSLLHALALDVGFDEVWPQHLRGAVLEATLCRAWGAAPLPPSLPATVVPTAVPVPEPALPPVVVNLANGSCRVAGRVLTLPRECTRMLHNLASAYPAAAPRAALADNDEPALHDAGRHSRRVDATASRLRQALRAAGLAHLRVRAVRRVGYQLVLDALPDQKLARTPT